MKKQQFIYCPGQDVKEVSDRWYEHHYSDHQSKPFTGTGLAVFKYEFQKDKDLTALYIESTALGVYEIYLNGIRVGMNENGRPVFDELKPGPSDYLYTVYSDSYDLSSYLQNGTNTLVAIVGGGWWNGRISFNAFGSHPNAFCCELSFVYEDHIKTQVTDQNWLSGVGGPVLFADLWDGETIDARIPFPTEFYSNVSFLPSVVYPYEGQVKKRIGPPVRIIESCNRSPISCYAYKDIIDNHTEYGEVSKLFKRVGDNCECGMLSGGYHLVVDFGQNMVGKPRIKLKSKRDTEVQIHFAEMLNDSGDTKRGNDGPKGSLYLKNYRGARAMIGYTANGMELETIEPLYTFYGFRYLEVYATDDIEIEEITGLVLSSLLKETGSLTTSNEEVNKLISNVEWGRRGNYLYIPTDCPQRDERLGWSGDTQIFANTAAYLTDIRGFMHKWLNDARDSQKRAHGAYGDVIPQVLPTNNLPNAGWGDAGILVPYVLYKMYKDIDLIKEHYPSMIEYLTRISQNDYHGLNAIYGDWLAYEETSKEYIALCYTIKDFDTVAFFSSLIKEHEGDEYSKNEQEFKRVATLLRKRFFSTYFENGFLKEQTQTAYVLALSFDLIPEEYLDQVKEKLVMKIINNDYTLSTGFLGTGNLPQTLSKIGRDDLAYSLLLQTKDPSWLYSVRQGATTIWERWNSYTIKNGFGDVSMNSFNHYAYGSVLEWLYSGCAGIQMDFSIKDYPAIILSPKPDTRSFIPEGQKRIDMVDAKFDSVYGTIRSHWYYVSDVFEYSCQIPKGCVATITFPCVKDYLPCERDELEINGIHYSLSQLMAKKEGSFITFQLESGAYIIR